MQAYFENYLQNLKELHTDIINAFQNLPPAALDWSPAEKINSINVLVVHTVGAQRFLIGEIVAGKPSMRDRDAEFKISGLDAAALSSRLEESYEYTRGILDGLSMDDLVSPRDFRGRATSVAWVLGGGAVAGPKPNALRSERRMSSAAFTHVSCRNGVSAMVKSVSVSGDRRGESERRT